MAVRKRCDERGMACQASTRARFFIGKTRSSNSLDLFLDLLCRNMHKIILSYWYASTTARLSLASAIGSSAGLEHMCCEKIGCMRYCAYATHDPCPT